MAACRRSISTRGILLTRRLHPAFGYITHEDDAKGQPPAADPSRLTANNFLHSGYGNNNLNGVFSGCAALFRGGGCSSIAFRHGLGSSLCSYSSSAIGGGSDKMDYMSNAAEFLTEKSVEVASQAPIASEVAIAAADSYFPVAALQYVIDGVHSFTGLNWWASIALTTLMIRLATIPISIHQIKATSKLALLKPHLEEIKEQMQDMASDPKAFTEGQKRMKALFKEYGVSPFTPMKGLFIQGPVFISFFMAITNMVEKVPSFKEGGVFWFTDLTVPDPLYILPVLTSLTFLITVECNMQEGMEGNAAAGTMKNFSRIIAVLTIPFTMTFPKAIFCYWITSNLYSLTYGLVIKRPKVKKLLGLPELPVTPPSTSSKPPLSPFALFSSFKAAAKEPALLPAAPSQVAERKLTSSSIMSQRIKTLEKQVKGRKKNKKR